MRKERWFKIVLVCSGFFLMFFFLNWSTSVCSKDMETLTIAQLYDIPTLDPAVTSSGTAHNVIMAAYEKLIGYKKGTTEIEPILADSWEVSKDLLTHTFRLKKNVKFTDGTPFNAEAVKFTFDRLLAINKGPAAKFLNIKTVEVVDDFTVKFHLKVPEAPFLNKMASYTGPNIVSPTAVKSHETGGDWGQNWMRNNMVGTGPYKLQEWVPSQYVILVRNENYWKGWEGKHLDRIILKITPEYVTRKLMLQTGTADFIDNPQAEDLENLGKIPGVVVEKIPTINPHPLLFNYLKEPMRNKKLRQAITYAFDYKGVLDILGMGTKQLQGPLPSGIWGHNKKLPIFKQDIPRAKQLLKEAGYKEGELTLSYVHWTSDTERRIAEVFQSSLQRIGINLKVRPITWAAYTAMYQNPNKEDDIFVYEVWAHFADPDSILGWLFESTAFAQRGFKNAKVDELLQKARITHNQAERIKYYKELQEVLVEEYTGIWAYEMSSAIVMKKYVKGFVPTSVYYGIYNFYDMYLEK
jgi:peptide/nickel transport system substrate-binding protein